MGDKDKRKSYDLFGAADCATQRFRQEMDPSHIFNKFFSDFKSRQRFTHHDEDVFGFFKSQGPYMRASKQQENRQQEKKYAKVFKGPDGKTYIFTSRSPFSQGESNFQKEKEKE